MATVGQPYSSGSWVVKEGNDAEFVARWTLFTTWSKENAPGAESFYLIQDAQDPRRYMSFGGWSDAEAVSAWRARPEFQQLLGACRELCDGLRGTRLHTGRFGRRLTLSVDSSREPLRQVPQAEGVPVLDGRVRRVE
jgi:heme-degrading monooxygenase HmoA